MTNPIFQINAQTPNGPVVESMEVNLNGESYDSGKTLGFLVGFAEGIMTFVPGPIPINIANYAELTEYEQMRARELLVLLQSVHSGRSLSPVSGMAIKIKLELEKEIPQVLVYEFAEV